MKLRTALSLTALLAGAGISSAQDQSAAVNSSAVMPANSGKPATFMEYMRTKKSAQTVSQTVEVAAPAAGGAAVVSGPVYAEPSVPMATGPQAAYVPNFYGSAEYLLWRLGGTLDGDGTADLPSIRRTVPYVFRTVSYRFPASDQPGVPVTINEGPVDIYGLVNTNPVLFSGSNLDSNDRNGARLTIGWNLGSDWGVEATGFMLQRRTASFFANAASNIEITTGLTDLFNQPADVDGVRPPPVEEPVVINPLFSQQIYGTSSNKMWGFELNARARGYQIGTTRLEGILGFRALRFEEEHGLAQDLGVQEVLYIGSSDGMGGFNPSAINYTTLVNGSAAENTFYGLQAGLFAECTFFGFFLNGTAKVAVGGMRQEFAYSEDVFTGSSLPGAVLPVMPNNVYLYPTSYSETRTRLTWIPELTANLGYDFCDCCRGWVGYNILWVNRVIRPQAGSLPTNGDGTIFLSGANSASPGPAITQFTETKIIAHGLNFGLELRY